ncbi:DUF3306 domain-containing protein [Oceanicella sp. SM1341]|uniref:DUF3306 domain-containing protein n=1 Tax=Oceanicella sp. SM1341 TaxID=1548889 RepID=UPI0018E52CB6|nr:DUF3306 domain-containing protein [Oceanicella sp. SM1341]
MSRGDGSRGDGFLDRWSRRKRGLAPEAGDPTADAPAAALPEASPEPAPQPAPDPEATDAEILESLGLPDPDTLRPGDDFSAFMRSAVPRRLRNRALRRLWASDPVLACLDGLNDYEEDFTDAATVVPDLRTAYKVGQGMFDRKAEAARAAAPPPAPRDEPGGEAPPEAAGEATGEAPGEASAPGDTGAAPAPETARPAPSADAAAQLSPRRSAMRFRFEEDGSNPA